MMPADESIDWPTLWRLATQGFALGEHSAHGPGHWRNVERNGLDLADSSGAVNRSSTSRTSGPPASPAVAMAAVSSSMYGASSMTPI